MLAEKIIFVRNAADFAAHGIRRVSIALGVFDGVHRGHQKLLAELAEIAEKTESLPLAVTFSPHPRSVLSASRKVELVVSEKEKYDLLLKAGAKAAAVIPFDREFAALSPDAFLEKLLHAEGLQVCGLCVGKNFRFGAGAEGDMSLLEKYALREGFLFRAVPELEIGGETVSSTAVRTAVMNGDLAKAESFLGRKWSISGIVERGLGLAGKCLGAPTANIRTENTVLPPFGVYASLARAGGKIHPAVVNIGLAPTIRKEDSLPPRAEAHLLDFSGDLYGQDLHLDIVSMIRPEKKFSSVEELKVQICADAAETYGILQKETRKNE